MERVRFVQHGGKDILLVDFSECKPDEAHLVIDKAKALISTKPMQSLLTLTNVTNLRFDEKLNDHMKEYAAHNKPFVRAGAVVGIVGLKKIIFQAVMMFSKRKLDVFDTVDQAKTWLVTMEQ